MPRRTIAAGAPTPRTKAAGKALSAWQFQVPACAAQLSDLHRQDLAEMAEQVNQARRIALRLSRSRQFRRRSVEQLIEAVRSLSTQAEIVTSSLAIHLATYRAERHIPAEARKGK